MSNALFIRLTDLDWSKEGPKAEWLLSDEAGMRKTGGIAPLASIVSHIELYSKSLKEVIIVLPGYHILVNQVTVSHQPNKTIHNALLFAVEELLADAVEDIHISATELPDTSSLHEHIYTVAVIRHDLMNKITQHLAAAQLQPTFITSETLLLPYTQGQAVALFSEDKILFRLSHHITSTLETDTFLSFFENHLSNSTSYVTDAGLVSAPFQTFQLWTDNKESKAFHDIRERLSLLCEDNQIPMEIHILEESVLNWLSSNYLYHKQPRPINMLQGIYRQQSAMSDILPHKRTVGVLLGLWLVIQLTSMLAAALYLNYETGQYYQESVALYHHRFPGDTVITDLKSQTEKHLQAPSPAGLFAPLEIVAKYSQEAGLPMPQVLRYNAANDTLTLEMPHTETIALEQFKQSVQEPAFTIEVTTSTQDMQNTVDTLTIKRNVHD